MKCESLNDLGYEALCGSYGAVLSMPKAIPLSNFSDRVFSSYGCHAGNLSALLPSARGSDGSALWDTYLSGCGTDIDEGLARLKAVCEAAERYSSCILLEHEYIVASANELGERALDWRRLPSLSEQERALPNQQFHAFDPDDPMRWVDSVNLNTGKRQYVPAVMTHLYPRSWSSERFWGAISTGTAVHYAPAAALVTAISEVVERDAIALTWLLRRPLRRIAFRQADLVQFPSQLRNLLEQKHEYMLFDATTDVGLPTVYLRRHRPAHPHAVNLVTCASGFCFADACFKAVREVATLSSILDTGQMRPVASPEACFRIEDGAVFMAQPGQAHAFAFLDGDERVGFADLQARQPLPQASSAEQQLGWLKRRAQALDYQILLTELTCDELKPVGLRCFRALVPDLMPMSTITTARYLGTPRLSRFHAYLQQQGEIARGTPLVINPFPQAFA